MKTHNTLSTGIFRDVIVRVSVLSMLLLPAAGLSAQDDAVDIELDSGNLRTFVELVRSDIRTEKAIIIAQNIDFTADEEAEFWPLHREYNLEFNKLLDERLALIKKFLASGEAMTEAQAKGLAQAAFDLEAKRTALKRDYFAKFSEVVPAVKAARFFQIENQLNAAIDLRIAAALPLIQ